ncbi:MAG: SGNH/GDSL hydrolase family protein [Cyclobacteriaceae bacterium]|nr:SGNH/GDSL hydrolase family protein [Cyclobacteriaceae bacterium]
MRQILLYGDSLSWGLIPGTRDRLAHDKRWPGIMEKALQDMGMNVRVIEDCLNGRRTAWDDPFKAGRNGLQGLGQRIEVNSPLDLVILVLGTNDFQSTMQVDAFNSARGVETLVNEIRKAPVEPGMDVPAILIIAPPHITAPVGDMGDKFKDADIKSQGLVEALRIVADNNGCHFYDSNEVVSSGLIDGVHLDVDAHPVLGPKVAEVVKGIIGI